MEKFAYTIAAQHVVFARGGILRLEEEIEAFGWQRLILCTTPQLRRNGVIDKLSGLLGRRLVDIFEKIEPHVPDAQVLEAVARAEQRDIDAVIGLGGGSPIGLAKALAYSLDVRRVRVTEPAFPRTRERARIPIIAIPTTYAGSEMTPVFGITYTEADGSKRKVTTRDPKITPRLTVYDPELTQSLPSDMTASTGINALAHCIEAVYSRTRNPQSTSAALRGMQHISRSLIRCYQNGDDLEARTEMLIGAHLGGIALASVEMGLHHGTGQVLGGTAGVPHGVANCIVLPHAMRFNARAAASQLAMSAESLGMERNGRSEELLAFAAADYIDELVRSLRQPQRLRDAGVPEHLLPRLAENILKSPAVQNNPRPVQSVEESLKYLEAMW